MAEITTLSGASVALAHPSVGARPIGGSERRVGAPPHPDESCTASGQLGDALLAAGSSVERPEGSPSGLDAYARDEAACHNGSGQKRPIPFGDACNDLTDGKRRAQGESTPSPGANGGSQSSHTTDGDGALSPRPCHDVQGPARSPSPQPLWPLAESSTRPALPLPPPPPSLLPSCSAVCEPRLGAPLHSGVYSQSACGSPSQQDVASMVLPLYTTSQASVTSLQGHVACEATSPTPRELDVAAEQPYGPPRVPRPSPLPPSLVMAPVPRRQTNPSQPRPRIAQRTGYLPPPPPPMPQPGARRARSIVAVADEPIDAINQRKGMQSRACVDCLQFYIKRHLSTDGVSCRADCPRQRVADTQASYWNMSFGESMVTSQQREQSQGSSTKGRCDASQRFEFFKDDF